MRIYDAHALRRVLSFRDLIEPVACCFVEYSAGLGDSAMAVLHPTERSDLHLKAACLPGHSMFVVKAAGWSAELADRGLPPGSGLVIALDVATCQPLALFRDEHYISDVRTAAAGAVVAKLLAPATVNVAAILGTGVQAFLQALALHEVRPFTRLLVWGRDAGRAHALVGRLRPELPEVQLDVASSVEEATRASDVMVTATASREPLVRGEWLHPGQHVTAVGADDLGKAELDATCLARADRLIVDSRVLTRSYGDVARALARREISPEQVHAEIGEVLAGKVVGRRSSNDLTIAKLIGLGVQDLAAVEVALARLTGAGQTRAGDGP